MDDPSTLDLIAGGTGGLSLVGVIGLVLLDALATSPGTALAYGGGGASLTLALVALVRLIGPRAIGAWRAWAAGRQRIAEAEIDAEAKREGWLRRWRTWRIDGFERDSEGSPVALTGAVRTLVPEGAQTPDPTVTPFPWNLAASGSLTTQALAVVRVTAVVRPALSATLAGLGLDAVAEAEPERT